MTIRHDDRIRERAFALWEAAGRPEGRDMEHWLRAERELRTESAPSSGNRDSVAATASAPSPKAVGPAPQAEKAPRKRADAGGPVKAGKGAARSTTSRKKKDTV